MKYFFLTSVILLFSLAPSFAQVSVSTESMELDVVAKRAVAKGNSVFIDLVITCNADWDQVGVDRCEVYDDEGNYYSLWDAYGNGGFRIDILENGERIPNPSGACPIKIAKGIPRKVRILVKAVDEYATEFKLIKIQWRGNMVFRHDINTTIKDLPITRE